MSSLTDLKDIPSTRISTASALDFPSTRISTASALNSVEPISNNSTQVTQQRMEPKEKLKCGLAILLPFLALCIAMMASSFHIIEEGNVGIYFRQGALMVNLNQT